MNKLIKTLPIITTITTNIATTYAGALTLLILFIPLPIIAQTALKNKEAPKSTATSLSEIQSLKSQAMKEVKAKQVKMNLSSKLKKQWEDAWACMQVTATQILNNPKFH
jgi:hypothetical protein